MPELSVCCEQVRETARKRQEEASRDERGKRMAYWGYRFEQVRLCPGWVVQIATWVALG